MGDIFQEVDEDIRKDKIKLIWKRYKIFIILALIIILGGVSSHSLWTKYKLNQMEETSEKYFIALDLVDKNEQEGLEALRLFSEEERKSSPIYSLIARLNEAAIEKSKNNFKEALNIYTTITKENNKRVFKDYAYIQSAEILMQLNKLNEAKVILSSIIKTNSTFSSIGKEYLGYIAIKENKFEEANKIFYELIEDASVSESVKNRVVEILDTKK